MVTTKNLLKFIQLKEHLLRQQVSSSCRFRPIVF